MSLRVSQNKHYSVKHDHIHHSLHSVSDHGEDHDDHENHGNHIHHTFLYYTIQPIDQSILASETFCDNCWSVLSHL